MKEDSFWDWEGFHFQYRHCNIVFTPDKLKAFLRKHCSLQSKAVEDLAGYSTPIETLAFDAGCVVVKPNPPLRLFNLGALPSELILLVMKLLFNQTKSRSNIDDLKSLSNISRRFRAIAAPLLFSRIKFYGRCGGGNSMQEFINNPIPRPIVKHVATIRLAFRLNPPPDKSSTMWEEMVHRYLSYISGERQKQDAWLTKLWVTLIEPKNLVSSDHLEYVRQIAGCISSGLSTLRELNLFARSMEVKQLLSQLLPQISGGLKFLLLPAPKSAEALDGLEIPSLQYLLVVSPLPGFSVHQYQCLDTLVVVPNFSDNEPWTFAELQSFLSACPSTLRLLHLGLATLDDPMPEKATAIPFGNLIILRLASVRIRQTERGSRPLAPMFSDLFSLAPIRRLYFRYNMKLERKSGITTTRTSFWDGLVDHRVRKRSGWKQLESVIHDGFPIRNGQKENSELLESDGVVLEHDGNWWVEW